MAIIHIRSPGSLVSWVTAKPNMTTQMTEMIKQLELVPYVALFSYAKDISFVIPPG